MNQLRITKVLQKMETEGLEQILVSDSSAIFYLTGKWIHPGERLLALIIKKNKEHKLLINELFPIEEDLGAEKIWFNDTQDGVEILAKHIDPNAKLGIDKYWPAKFLLKLMEIGGASGYVNGSDIIDRIRMNKDAQEQEFMREASRLNDEAMGLLQKQIVEGMSEKQLSSKLAEIYEELKTEGFSFTPIIGFGKNGANPHHDTGTDTLNVGDGMILDIGCVKDSYCSDMTRTVFFKEASSKGKEIYAIVKEANERAIALVKPGVRFCDIDGAARNYITEKGYGKYFTHRTGHSIGIEVHDFGDVSSINEMQVEEGMIFSIEPGIYLQGEVGVRIEDLVLVTKDGCEILNKYTKDFTIIG